MDNSKRAEKIYGIIAQWNIDQMDDDALMFQITSQLDEVVREAIAEEHTKLFECECRADDYGKGFAAAREKAAGIAEKGPGPGGILYCDGDVRDPGVVVTGYQKWIAERIRAMEEK